MTTWNELIQTIKECSTEYEISQNGKGVTFTQCVDLENFSRFQSLLATYKEFVGLEIVTIDAVIAPKEDISFSQLTEHPSFAQQPFGLYPAGDFWFITATMPLRNLNLDDFYALAFKVAWIADVIRQTHHLETN
jgi:hypothetical protein